MGGTGHQFGEGAPPVADVEVSAARSYHVEVRFLPRMLVSMWQDLAPSSVASCGSVCTQNGGMAFGSIRMARNSAMRSARGALFTKAVCMTDRRNSPTIAAPLLHVRPHATK